MSYNLLESTGNTFVTNDPALAVGSTTSRIAFGGTNYSFRGVFGLRTANANSLFPIEPGTGAATSPNAYSAIPAGQTCLFVILIDPLNANAVTGLQGPIVNQGDLCPVPAIPNNRVAIGAVKVLTVTNPFVQGTSSLSGAGITSTFFGFSTPPGVAI